MKALPWIAAAVLIAVMAWTNPTKFDYYNAIEEYYALTTIPLPTASMLNEIEKFAAGRGLQTPAAYNNYIVFSTLKFSLSSTSPWARAKDQPIRAIGFLGRVFVTSAGSFSFGFIPQGDTTVPPIP